MPLTDLSIKNAKPKIGRIKMSDGGGLHVEISPGGTKTWKLAYRFAGKQKAASGGRYPDVKLADARIWREQLKALLRDGKDPAKVATETRRAAVAVQTETFEQVALDWLDKNRGRWTEKQMLTVRRRLELDPFKLFGSRPIADIGHADMLSLIRRFEQRNALEVRKKTMGYVSRIMLFAKAEGKVRENPVPDIRDAMKPAPKVKHHAKLSAAQLPEFFGRLARSGQDPVTKLAIRWTILTMVRTNETRFFRADEIEGRGTPGLLWRIPGARMKMQTDHIVPLSRQAAALLDEIDTMARAQGSAWQFPQAMNPKKPISENCQLYALYDLGYKGKATIHGFRGLASTVLNEQTDADGRRRFDEDWIEMQLAHDPNRGSVRGAYNAAKYETQRRHMVQWWGDYIEDMDRIGRLL